MATVPMKHGDVGVEQAGADQSLLEWERRFEAVFNVIPQATAIIRLADGVHLQINDAFTRITGYTPDEIIGKSAVTLGIWRPEERATYIRPLATPPGGSAVVPFRTKDGRSVRLALSVRHLDFGGEPCMVTVGVDVTEQQANDALRQSEAQARVRADELAAMMDAVPAAVIALRETDRRKDEFLALLSHELRNLLTPILTAAQLLKLRADPETHAGLDVIIRQAKHLVRLVDNLLDVSRVTRDKLALTKERIELSRVVAQAVEATGHLFEGRQHHLELSVPEEGLAVDADEVRLTQVVSNLLSKAAHFTPPGGTVTVTGGREGDYVGLRVRDTGLGIDPALLPNVFEMFMQSERGRAEGGLGLGLSIVRALVAQHGGTVTAHNEGLGRGSEFSIQLLAAPGGGVQPC